ncbi:MAG: chemotaxis protein methyltransferase WspC [Alteromonadaceae bacterium]|jgi:chemotaxis protein methyltransferase WspC
MISTTFIRWVKDLISLDITAYNEKVFALTLAQHARTCGLAVDQYCQKLMAGQLPIQPFIDAVTTHESFFFRHKSAMKFIIQSLLPPLMNKANKVNVLSLPCAQGEEPWSLAIMMAEHNIPLDRVNIYATDIAESSITKAKKGHYSSYALHKVTDSQKEKYFILMPDGTYSLARAIRKFEVLFQRQNLFNPLSADFPVCFDIIFCQNLLMYFNKEDQQRALTILASYLAPDGWLFIDPAEAAVADKLYKRQGPSHIAAFQLKGTSGSVNKKDDSLPAVIKASKPRKKKNDLLVVNAKRSKVNQTKNCQKTTLPVISTLLADAQQAYQVKNFPLAIDLFEQIITSKSHDLALAYFGLAKLFSDENNKFAALEMAEYAIEMKSNLTDDEQVEMHFILAYIQYSLGIKKSAKINYDQIVKLQPTSPLVTVLMNKIIL